MTDQATEFPELRETLDAFARSNFVESERLAADMLAAAEERGDPVLAALAVSWIGASLVQQSRYRDGLSRMRRAVDALTDLDRRDLAARSLNYIAVVYEELGDFDAALESYHEALAIARSTGQLELVGRILGNMGEAFLDNGANDTAQPLLTEAAAILKPLEEWALFGWVQLNLGRLCQAMGEPERAREHFVLGIESTDRGRNVRWRAEARVGLGALYSALGDHDRAIALLDEALALAQSVSVRREVFKTHLALSEAHERAGNLATALDHYKAFHAMRTEVFDSVTRATMHSLTAEMELEKERHAREIWRLRNVELGAALERLEDQARELVRLSVRDGLTGVFNRRHLDSHLQSEIERSTRNGLPISAAMVDLDQFKRINDTLSHAVGDRTLKAIAGIIQDHLRQNDIVARYGGEEFALIFPDTPLDAAVAACERIRAAIEHYAWSELDPSLHVTASFGVVEHCDVMDAGALLAEADARMYEAKAAGRNRVVA